MTVRTTCTIAAETAARIDALSDEHPAFEGRWQCRRSYSGKANRSARLEALVAYAADVKVPAKKAKKAKGA